MVKRKRKLILNVLSVVCCLVVTAVSASSMAPVQSKAQMIGVIAGAFGAGAAFVNAVRDHVARRGEPK